MLECCACLALDSLAPQSLVRVSFPSCSMCQPCYITPNALSPLYFSFRKDPGLHLLYSCGFCPILLSAVSALGSQCSCGCSVMDPLVSQLLISSCGMGGEESLAHRPAAFPQRKLCVGWELTAFNDYMLNLLPINN